MFVHIWRPFFPFAPQLRYVPPSSASMLHSFHCALQEKLSGRMYFTVASILCLIIFIGWSTIYVLVPRVWQDAAITGGLVATATAILVTVFIHRTYVMMTVIISDHLASVLPLFAYTSATSIHDINYWSTQVLYDTVTSHPLVRPSEVTGQVNPNFYSEQPQSPHDSSPGTSNKIQIPKLVLVTEERCRLKTPTSGTAHLLRFIKWRDYKTPRLPVNFDRNRNTKHIF